MSQRARARARRATRRRSTPKCTIATGQLVRAEDELAIKRAMLRHRLVDIYKRGPLYTTEALLTAESFGALVARYKYLHLLALRDRALVARVEQLPQSGRPAATGAGRLQRRVEDNRQEKTNEEERLRSLAVEREHSLVQAKRAQQATQTRLAQIALAEARLARSSTRSRTPGAGRRAARMRRAPPSASTLTTRDFGQPRLAGRRHDPLPVRPRGEPQQHDDALERHRHRRAARHRRTRRGERGGRRRASRSGPMDRPSSSSTAAATIRSTDR